MCKGNRCKEIDADPFSCFPLAVSALVVKVFADNAPQYAVLIAYGTSKKADRLLAGEFLIAPMDRAAYKLAGLSYPTKFNFKQTVELP